MRKYFLVFFTIFILSILFVQYIVTNQTSDYTTIEGLTKEETIK